MEIYVSSISKHNATKTDLSLLLECLKYQMKCPASQKQALFTIYSICQQREENVDFFREMGGVVFVHNLSKSSAHSEVRETAQFTLGMLAEANVYCKQALCRRETFSDLAECLMQQDSPLTQRRVAVYLLSVLVANNRSGQTFAQTSGCLDILLDLFRTSFPLSGEATVRPANVTQLFQLWTSVSSALCGCVNNPQNGNVCVFVSLYSVLCSCTLNKQGWLCMHVCSLVEEEKCSFPRGEPAYVCVSLPPGQGLAAAALSPPHRDGSAHLLLYIHDCRQQP